MSRGLTRYPSVRDSDVPWLRGVPAHWAIEPFLAAYQPRLVKNTGLKENTVLSLSYGRIVVKPEEKLHGLVPESFETYQIVDVGNIIVRTTDLQNDRTSLRVGISRTRGIITSAYLCLTTRGLLSDYGYLQLHAYDLLKILYGFGSGLRQNLDFTHIKRLPILVPPQNEQAAIVRFLANSDRQIRECIRTKRRVLALLGEQKRTIIQRVVTRGLDATVRLKPCHLEWLDHMPEHWQVRRNATLFRERNESGRVGLPILAVSLVTGVTVSSDVDESGRPRRLISEPSSYKFAKKGDIVYNTMRMWQGALGVAPTDGMVSPAYTVAVPRDGVNAEYYAGLFRTAAYMNEVNRRSRGIAPDRNRLYWDDFKAIASPMPPIVEQEQIVNAFTAETTSIDRTINSAQREMNLLNEYGVRLTVDVTLGKFDIREAAKELPDDIFREAAPVVPDEELEDADEKAEESIA